MALLTGALEQLRFVYVGYSLLRPRDGHRPTFGLFS
ncbi:hypothetical protein ABH940_003635 [Streptacidiphilus sp. BW17]